MRVLAAWFFLATGLCVPAAAATLPPPQSPSGAEQSNATPHRVRGTIVSFDGKLLTVKSDTAETVAVGVLPTTIFLYNEPRKVSDIHSGDFLGSAAVPGSDGKLHAQDVRLFPEQLRGMGEGQYPMGDPGSNRSMTNATVAQVTAVARGGTLRLTYHGAGAPGDPNCSGHAAKDGSGCVGQTEIVVAPGVPILAYVVGDSSALVPGAAISMSVATGPDGALIAPRVLVEHNGIKPI
jgi:hypothetical protein